MILNKFSTEDKPTKENEIKIKLEDLEKRIAILKESEINSWSTDLWRLKNEKGDMERDLKNLKKQGS